MHCMQEALNSAIYIYKYVIVQLLFQPSYNELAVYFQFNYHVYELLIEKSIRANLLKFFSCLSIC